ncbi:MAG: AAA family ATPase, partial [Elainellaceae cyanobacterium]
VLDARRAVEAIAIKEVLVDYLLALIQKTRHHSDLILGASPRAAVAWLRAAQAHAWLAQRDYVTPDDLRGVALPLLRHRLILNPEAQLDGVQIDALITALLDQAPVPR